MIDPNLILSENGKILIGIKDKNIQHIDIPENVTEIGEKAFYECKSIHKIDLPYSVKTIGELAFYLCDNLQTINIPESVYKIGKDALICSSLNMINVNPRNKRYYSENGILYDRKLNTIICYPMGKKEKAFSIPQSIKRIGDSAIINENLQSVEIPNSVTHIGERAFLGCVSLQTVEIPNSVTHIGEGAFAFCSNILSIQIPNSVVNIGKGAFLSCSRLKTIIIPDSISKINSILFQNCDLLLTVYIPNSVTKIDCDAFIDCPSLENIIVESSNEKYISENGILFNKKKSRILCYPAGKKEAHYTIPTSVKEIEFDAFRNNEYLQSIVIPKSVTDIWDGAFYGCSSLLEIHCQTEKPNNIYCDDSFSDELLNTCTLYVPRGIKGKYRQHRTFKYFKFIEPEKKR